MNRVVPLEADHELSRFGAKAVGLGQALRDGLPVPSGFALDADLVEAVASGDDGAITEVIAAVGGLVGPLAVRSPAIDEDGAAASRLDCYGLTYWDFRPLVEANGVIGWKLLQRMAMLLREASGG